MSSEKMSPAEAERRLAEEYAAIRDRWEKALLPAQAIAKMRGLEGELALVGHSPEGEFFMFEVERFAHRTTPGDWEDVWDDRRPGEEHLWQELDRVLSGFGRSLPPRSDDPVTKPEDIIESEHDLQMFMFGVQDSDGYFVYDDKGVVTNVEGLWL